MNKETIIHEKADRIRDVIRYIRRFKNALVIIYIDDKLIDSPIFLSHIKDICYIHESGLKVILVPGASKRISEILTSSNIPWSFYNNCRITGPEAMPLIKMAAFDVSNQIMTAFAGEKKTAVIGNWVRARGKGVINGFDYSTAGEIDKLQIDSIQTVLDNGFIPIFPCIGWSVAGKPYNISSIQLAEQIAIRLKADKLFYLVPGADINNSNFSVPKSIGLSPEGTVPAMNLEELDSFIEANLTTNHSEVLPNSGDLTSNRSVVTDSDIKAKIFFLLQVAKEACKEGVTRVHILNGSFDGSVPCEIFSDLGSGTMIYANNYGHIRPMIREDIAAVLTLMKPFVDEGILLPRTKQMLHEQLSSYIVYEIDGAIRATAALIPYPDGQMEIAGVAVDKSFSHIGLGPKLIEYLLQKAKENSASRVFLLTTQTADWFEHLGFVQGSVDELPAQRKEKWTPNRGSKVLFYGDKI
ncbi:MAG: amino-acid N-acetyltransferase [Treponema sp.]|nr:amino-acid N-acetyltransferase [Treponema sp.]